LGVEPIGSTIFGGVEQEYINVGIGLKGKDKNLGKNIKIERRIKGRGKKPSISQKNKKIRGSGKSTRNCPKKRAPEKKKKKTRAEKKGGAPGEKKNWGVLEANPTDGEALGNLQRAMNPSKVLQGEKTFFFFFCSRGRRGPHI